MARHDGGSQMQDALVREWPHGKRQAAPVWHMDEPLHRLLRLCEEPWHLICIGSTAEYAVVLSDAWQHRWTKWERQRMPVRMFCNGRDDGRVTAQWQERTCLRCGFYERRELRNLEG